MGTVRPSPIEGIPEPPLQETGPWAPKVVGNEVIASGPLESRLRGVQGKEVKAPEGKEFIGQLARRLPEPHLSNAVAFLRSVEPGKVEGAAQLLLDELRALKQRIDKLENPKAALESCISKVEKQIGRTVH